MGTAPLHEKYDVALLDLDGVVYLGGTAIPSAPPALQRAREAGMHLAYVTNNASRTPAADAELLHSMDVPARAADVVTSPQAAARLLADKLPPGAPVLVIGSLALRMAVRERGLRPVSSASDSPLAVVQGYAPGIDYQSLAEGALAVRAGALFVGTNADSIIRTGARRPLVVGDRLDTDIEAASRAATDSLLVFTGVSRPADLPVAPPEHRPTYLALTLDALMEAYPDVILDDDAAACNGWTARWQDRHGQDASVTRDGAGAPIDGLRALCAAAWSREGTTAGAVSAALSRIALS